LYDNEVTQKCAPEAHKIYVHVCAGEYAFIWPFIVLIYNRIREKIRSYKVLPTAENI